MVHLNGTDTMHFHDLSTVFLIPIYKAHFLSSFDSILNHLGVTSKSLLQNPFPYLCTIMTSRICKILLCKKSTVKIFIRWNLHIFDQHKQFLVAFCTAWKYPLSVICNNYLTKCWHKRDSQGVLSYPSLISPAASFYHLTATIRQLTQNRVYCWLREYTIAINYGG